MPILNYTTSIEASKTVNEIQKVLAKHGAKSCLLNYDDEGHIESLSFTVIAHNKEVGIQLPINPDAVLRILDRQNVTGKYRTRTHAIRVSWRIVKHWVEAQMAILETEMVSIDQIFLPYIITGDGRTVYELISSSKFQIAEKNE